MAKKKDKRLRTPAGLDEQGRKLWRQYATALGQNPPATYLAALHRLCRTFDTYTRFRQQIKRNELMIPADVLR